MHSTSKVINSVTHNEANEILYIMIEDADHEDVAPAPVITAYKF